MSVITSQSITRDFTTRNPSTGAAVDADSLPTGILVINGTDNAATVTVTDKGTGRYKAAVTMPTLAVGDQVEIVISATVNAIADNGIIWQDYADSKVDTRLAPTTAGRTLDVSATGEADANVVFIEGADATDTINAQCDLALTDYDGPTNTEMVARTIVSANYATSAEVLAIQNNTSTRVVVPEQLIIPDSGSTDYILDLYIYDEAGNMEAPDSAPTLAVVNQAGTDRSGNLGSITNPAAGHYRVTYNVDTADTAEQLRWTWTVVEGGATRLAGATSTVVTEAQAGSTPPTVGQIRTELETGGSKLDIAAVQAAAVNTKLGTPAGASVSADIAAVKTETAAILVLANYLKAAQVNWEITDVTATTGNLRTWPVGTAHVNGTGELSIVPIVRADATSPWTEATL